MLRPDAAQRHDGQTRALRQRSEADPAQHSCPRMRPRRKQGRQENEIRACPLGHVQLPRIMHRHAMDHRPCTPPGATPVPTIGTPGHRLLRRSRQQQHQPPPPRDLRHPVEQRPPFTRPRAIMPEQDSPPPLWQARGTCQQRLGRNALVRDQPDGRHIFSVATCHRPRL